MTEPGGMGIRTRIGEALAGAVRSLGVDGELPDLELGRAKGLGHGDYASPAGLKLARVLRKAPPQIAETIAKTIAVPDGAATAEAAGGYINFRLTAEWLQQLVADVASRGGDYGAADLGRGERLQVEFGSINPTGPMHIGHGRGVILGDSMSRLLDFTGHKVEREYYVNDQNTQARRFGASVWARMHGEEPPEGGYAGAYVTELAEMAKRDLGDLDSLPVEEAQTKVRAYAIGVIVEQLRASVARLNVRYDEWFPESRLWEQGLPQAAIERLRESGFL
ncbi:MAG TPA: arginine--tRNA ligase, partial [Streptosporangiaceae bacterium]|nr:arginine--tRNA ligase [Streptosporangiaceae bacterium]